MDDLLRLHDQMLAALDELERLTQSQRCDDKGVMAVRYRLTRASSARRRQVLALCERLLAERDDAIIASLRDETNASRAVSSSHIGTWTLRRVAADWDGYREASVLMQAMLRRQIARERTVLARYFA